MLEIITDIVKAEEKAKQIVSEAREQASRMKAEIEEQERQSVSDAKAEATELVQRTIADTRDTEEQRFQKALADHEQKRRTFHTSREKQIDRAVERAVGLLRRQITDE